MKIVERRIGPKGDSGTTYECERPDGSRCVRNYEQLKRTLVPEPELSTGPNEPPIDPEPAAVEPQITSAQPSLMLPSPSTPTTSSYPLFAPIRLRSRTIEPRPLSIAEEPTTPTPADPPTPTRADPPAILLTIHKVAKRKILIVGLVRY